jgi:hypothetical protein
MFPLKLISQNLWKYVGDVNILKEILVIERNRNIFLRLPAVKGLNLWLEEVQSAFSIKHNQEMGSKMQPRKLRQFSIFIDRMSLCSSKK